MTMTIRADEANFVQFGSSCFTSGNTQNQGSIERTQSRGVPGERGGESTDGCTPIDAGGEVMSRRRPTQRLVDQAWQPTSGLSGRWIGLSLSAENRASAKQLQTKGAVAQAQPAGRSSRTTYNDVHRPSMPSPTHPTRRLVAQRLAFRRRQRVQGREGVRALGKSGEVR